VNSKNLRFVATQIVTEGCVSVSTGIADQLTLPSVPPNMSSQWPRPLNPWGKLFPITASCARLAAVDGRRL